MAPRYLNEFHKRNSQARFGRSTVQMISPVKVESKSV